MKKYKVIVRLEDEPTLRLLLEGVATVRDQIQILKEIFEAHPKFRGFLVFEVVEQDLRFSDADLQNFLKGDETI